MQSTPENVTCKFEIHIVAFSAITKYCAPSAANRSIILEGNIHAPDVSSFRRAVSDPNGKLVDININLINNERSEWLRRLNADNCVQHSCGAALIGERTDSSGKREICAEFEIAVDEITFGALWQQTTTLSNLRTRGLFSGLLFGNSLPFRSERSLPSANELRLYELDLSQEKLYAVREFRLETFVLMVFHAGATY